MIAQTVRPARWIIVDDGSTDGTPEILAAYAERFPWIEVIRRSETKTRSVGPGVVDAFYAGLATVTVDDYEYVSKLDLDLELPPRYFEILLDRMAADPRLGTCSGKPYIRDTSTGKLCSERIGDEVSAGMTKLYRTACFRDIDGIVRGVMWDVIDCHRARLRGWVARSWDEAELRFVHLRQMGSSQHSLWTGRTRWGRGKWFMGSSVPYVAAAALYRMTERPYLVGGLGIFVGYIQAMLDRDARLDDQELRRFMRRYERLSLVVGKQRAMELYHRRIYARSKPKR